MVRNILSVVFSVFLIFASAQVNVTGKLIDKETKAPLPDADIFLKGTQTYTSSAEDGTFSIRSDRYIDSLEIDPDGYPTKYVPLQQGDNLDLVIEISKKEKSTTATKSLKEITVIGFPPKKVPKKENPAWGIMKELWKRKRTNGLANFKNYQYKEYEKIEFDLNNIDSVFISKKIFTKLGITPQDIDTLDISGKTYLPVFLNEAISDIVGENDPSKREKTFLTANKTSGMPKNDIVANTVKNLYKDIDIYDNTLNFFNKGFTSPVAANGFAVYEYLLIDTIDVDGVNCFHIKYRPLRANELTFKGDVYITTGTYNVRQINLQSSAGINVNYVKDIYMELEYDNVTDSVFIPLRNYTVLDMSLLSKKDGTKGMFAKRTLIYSDYEFDQPQQKIDSLISRQWEPMTEGAYDKTDDFWTESRPNRLNADDKNAYELVDRVSKTRLFTNIVDIVEVLSSGYINVGKVDLGDVYQGFGYNMVEGIRLRAGLRTFFSPNDMWRLEGYTAYGFKDEKFKYGAQARFMFNKFNRFTIGVGTKRDISQLGVSLFGDEGVMTRSFASSSIISRGDNKYLSSLNQTNVFMSIEPWKNIQFRLDGVYQYIKSANPTEFNIGYYDNKGVIQNDLYESHLTFSIQARPGAKYSRYGLDRYEHTTLAPTIILKYTRGLNGIFHSGFNYDKLQFLYNQPILWGAIGTTQVSLEAGRIFNPLPLSLLSIVPANQSYGIISNTFGLLNYYDFVTDTYSALHLEHHFNGRLFSYIPLLKKLQLREVVFLRGVWGDISDSSIRMNASNINYLAPKDHIYYEYGFGIENIGLGNLRFFRIDFNWRGNYFDMPVMSGNKISTFGMKVGMQFTF